MKVFLIASIISLCFTTLKAQVEPEEITVKFFEIYKNEGSDKALEYIFSKNRYSSENMEGINVLKRSLKNTTLAEGDFEGYELLSKKNAGQSFVLLTFLVRHDRDPLTFRILFYKPNKTWQVQNFKFDNKMDEELEEESKLSGYK